jgi:hypothetical protein
MTSSEDERGERSGVMGTPFYENVGAVRRPR